MSAVSVHEFVSRKVREVTASWHEFDERRDAAPLHVWLRVEPDVGWVRLHTAADGESLDLARQEPYQPYDMAECGRTVVEPLEADHVLMQTVDQRIVAADTLLAEWSSRPVGIVLRLASGAAVAAVNVGDEFEFDVWPSSRLAAIGVTVGSA